MRLLPALALTLTEAEVQALTLGLNLVAAAADPSLAPATSSLRAKIAAVAPPRLMQMSGHEDWVFPGPEALAAARHLPTIRRAIRARERLSFTYADTDGKTTERSVRPLVLEFWGRVWTLASWCEDRADFRSFRVDRITALAALKETFAEEPGKTLFDWRRLHPGPSQG